MENQQAKAVTLTQALVKIDSSDPGAYEGEIGTYIFDWLSGCDIPVIREEVLPGRYNIMAKIQGEIDDPALVYICHMDTVTLGSGWSGSPLSGEISDGNIFGRGACDMKSGLACAMSAFSRVAARNEKPKHSFALIVTVDEEDFMRGSEAAIRSEWVTNQSWVLDTEPTNGQIQVAHKGRTWFELKVAGVTAHAGTPWKGADAIAGMAEAISYIRKEIAVLPSHADLGDSTVTFGQIEGGYRPYVVPDSCRAWLDMRLVPPADTKTVTGIVNSALRLAAQEVPGIKGSFQITGDRPYVEKDENSFLLKKLQAACQAVTGAEPVVSAFPGYTDTAVIAGVLGNHNCMSYGPGDLELAHKPNEYVPCSDILRCEEVLHLLAEEILYN